MDGLDDVFVVPREIKEASTFAWRAKFGEDIFACQRHKIVRGIKRESRSQISENPRCVIFKFEIVFCRGCQFIAGALGYLVRASQLRHLVTHMSKENLCLASKSVSISSRSIFALVLETVKRIPVSML